MPYKATHENIHQINTTSNLDCNQFHFSSVKLFELKSIHSKFQF